MTSRTRQSIGTFLCSTMLLGELTFLGGCDGGAQSTGQVEVDPAQIKKEQDAMQAAMEKAHARPKKGSQ